MFYTLILVLAAGIAVILIVAALKPAEFRVVRSATMSAPPARVFGLVNDFHEWKAWSPWEKKDPAAKSTFEGPPAGVGTSLAWDGNNQVGSGKMTILESRAPGLIRIKLEFFKPMAGVSTAEFTFHPQGDQTTVTWTMTGKNNFIGRVFCLFANMDKMIGGDFEAGLAAIKRLAEAAGK